jgi:hypothetical protein
VCPFSDVEASIHGTAAAIESYDVTIAASGKFAETVPYSKVRSTL